jgi:hypothetical protein
VNEPREKAHDLIRKLRALANDDAARPAESRLAREKADELERKFGTAPAPRRERSRVFYAGGVKVGSIVAEGKVTKHWRVEFPPGKLDFDWRVEFPPGKLDFDFPSDELMQSTRRPRFQRRKRRIPPSDDT